MWAAAQKSPTHSPMQHMATSQPKLSARICRRAHRSHVRDFQNPIRVCESSSISGTPSGSHIFAARWFLTPQSLSLPLLQPIRNTHICISIHTSSISRYIYTPWNQAPPSLSLAICFPLKQPDRVREYICRERGREERGKNPNSSISRSKCVGSVRFSREVRFYCSSRSRALRFLFCG